MFQPMVTLETIAPHAAKNVVRLILITCPKASVYKNQNRYNSSRDRSPVLTLAGTTGEDERKTEYIWLCASCAEMMHPEVEVTEDSVVLRLTRNIPMLVADATTLIAAVN